MANGAAGGSRFAEPKVRQTGEWVRPGGDSVAGFDDAVVGDDLLTSEADGGLEIEEVGWVSAEGDLAIVAPAGKLMTVALADDLETAELRDSS